MKREATCQSLLQFGRIRKGRGVFVRLGSRPCRVDSSHWEAAERDGTVGGKSCGFVCDPSVPGLGEEAPPCTLFTAVLRAFST